MKVIVYSKKFKSNFLDKIRSDHKLIFLLKQKVNLLMIYPEHPELRNHELSKKRRDLRGLCAFSLADDCRVIYQQDDDYYYFIDIGNHKEIYGYSNNG